MNSVVVVPELAWTELAVMAFDIAGAGGIERLRERLNARYAALAAEVLALRAARPGEP